jgi:hypothetical protein
MYTYSSVDLQKNKIYEVQVQRPKLKAFKLQASESVISVRKQCMEKKRKKDAACCRAW